MKPLFKGKVKKGKVSYYSPELYDNHLKALEGEIVVTSTEKPRKEASNPQRKWLFGVAYKLIGDYLGLYPKEVHYCLPVMELRMDYTKAVPMPKSVSALECNTVEFNEYKEKLQKWGVEECNGLIIPDPEKVEV